MVIWPIEAKPEIHIHCVIGLSSCCGHVINIHYLIRLLIYIHGNVSVIAVLMLQRIGMWPTGIFIYRIIIVVLLYRYCVIQFLATVEWDTIK